MGIFDIFEGVTVNSSNYDKDMELNDIDNIDMSNVSKEELDKTMKFLDNLNASGFVNSLVGEDIINEVKAYIQAKWDMAHNVKEESETSNDPVSNRIDALVDEYMESFNIPNSSIMQKLIPMAKESYKKFAEFIYNHK